MPKKKILLVDDSKVIRRTLRALLEKYDLEISELTAAEDLFTNAEKFTNVNLILLDIDLPGMNGLTALEHINNFSAFSHIPVIILSGHSERTFVKRALHLAVVDYLKKPYVPQRLLERIENVIGPLTMNETK